jgi:hypothetical protein
MSKYSKNSSGPAGNVLLTDAEAVFYDAVQAAEVVRQESMKTASTQAQVRAADIAFHRAVRDAAVTAGTLGHLGGPSRQALRELTGGG